MKKVKIRIKNSALAGMLVASTMASVLGGYVITQNVLNRPQQANSQQTANYTEELVQQCGQTQANLSNGIDIVLSTNANTEYARRNVLDLQRKGFESRLETIVSGGQKLYRTIVTAADDALDSTLEQLKASNYLGTGYFFKKNGAAENKHDTGQDYIIDCKQREDFIRGTSAYIRWLRTFSKHGPVTAEYSNRLAAMMYDESMMRQVRPDIVAGIAATESSMSRIEGDLKFKPTGEHAQGYMQVRRPAMVDVVKHANKNGIRGLPSSPPRNIMDNPELQIRFGVYYLRILEDRYGDTRTAINRYNGPLGAQNGYDKKVLKYADKINDAIENPAKYEKMAEQREDRLRRTRHASTYTTDTGSN